MNEVLLVILVVTTVILFFGAIIGSYVYKKVHHMPTGECAYCHSKSKKTLKQYHKMYANK